MGMGYEAWIAQRYLWSRRRHPFVGVIGTISVLGITVGVAALIVVLAVMNGFDQDLKKRVIGMRSHAVVQKDGLFREADEIARKVAAEPRVRAVSPYIQGQALIQKGEGVTGVLVRGIDPRTESSVSEFFSYLTEGSFSGEGGVIVGAELAKLLRLSVGSEIRVLSQGIQKPLTFRVDGIFASGLYEYDANLMFTGLADADRLFGLDGAVTGLSVSLADADAARQVKTALQKSLGYPYYVLTWMDMNKTLFGALKLEKLVMFLILALIILVACFNIAGSLTILVTDKVKDIGVLKALGATPSALVRIFTLDGLWIGLIGAGAGFAIGSGLCFVVKNFLPVELPREIYYLDHLPIRMEFWDNLRVLGMAVALSFLSSCYPAWLAAKLDPVKALRYE